MEHFKQEGNFVVGGNIGAAVANCGREAYGAASLGVCTGAMPLENKTDHRVVGTTMKASRRMTVPPARLGVPQDQSTMREEHMRVLMVSLLGRV